jgi:hypothetical protein
MLVQIDSNNVINTDFISTIEKKGDNRITVEMNNRTNYRFDMKLADFLEKINGAPQLLTEGYNGL